MPLFISSIHESSIIGLNCDFDVKDEKFENTSKSLNSFDIFEEFLRGNEDHQNESLLSSLTFEAQHPVDGVLTTEDEIKEGISMKHRLSVLRVCCNFNYHENSIFGERRKFVSPVMVDRYSPSKLPLFESLPIVQ